MSERFPIIFDSKRWKFINAISKWSLSGNFLLKSSKMETSKFYIYIYQQGIR